MAATRPAALGVPSILKGIGPCKLEQYGHAILDVIADQSPTHTGEIA